MVRVADCVPVLLADPERGRGRRRARRATGPGRRRRAGRGRGDARRSAPRQITAWVGPHVCGACYEVPEQLRAEVSAVVPEPRTPRRPGAPPRSTSAPACAPSSPRDRRRGRRRVALHDRGRRPLLLPPPGHARPAGWPAWCGCGRDRRAGEPRSPRASRRCAAGSPTPAREAGRVAGRGDADRGHEVLPGLRRTPARRPRRAATWGRTGTRRREAKAAECADLGLAWHFIGGLQSNKAAAVAAYADVVESVDRAKLLSGLSKGAHQRDRTLDCLVQVDLDETPDPDRGGTPPAEVLRLAEQVASAEGLRLRDLHASTIVRIAMHVSSVPPGSDVAHGAGVRPRAGSRSSSGMICIARTFGAPRTVPAGKHGAQEVERVTPSESSPTTSETRWVMCEKRSGSRKRSTLHGARAGRRARGRCGRGRRASRARRGPSPTRAAAPRRPRRASSTRRSVQRARAPSHFTSVSGEEPTSASRPARAGRDRATG